MAGKSLNRCLTDAFQVDGAEVTTAEGSDADMVVEDDELQVEKGGDYILRIDEGVPPE